MIIKVKPLDEVAQADVEYEDEDILDTTRDEISEYNRNSDQCIFLLN